MAAPDTSTSPAIIGQGPRLPDGGFATKWPRANPAVPPPRSRAEIIPGHAPSPRDAAAADLPGGNVLQVDRLEYLPATLLGIVTHYVEPELRPKLGGAANDLRLAEDLGLDSLTMMEVMIRVDDLLQISISDRDLRQRRMLGDFRRYFEDRVTNGSAP